jgi:hypothetical protein
MRAGKDIMELKERHPPPGFLDLLLPAGLPQKRRPLLGLEEKRFRAAVSQTDRGAQGKTAGELRVQVAVKDGPLVSRLFQRGEVVSRCRHPVLLLRAFGIALLRDAKRTQAQKIFVLDVRNQQEGTVAGQVVCLTEQAVNPVPVVVEDAQRVLAPDVRRIRFPPDDQNLAAVESPRPEDVMEGRAAEAVRHERGQAELLENLRNLRVDAERVKEPSGLYRNAEVLADPLHSERLIADKRLPVGQVGIQRRRHAADKLQTPLLNIPLQSLHEVRAGTCQRPIVRRLLQHIAEVRLAFQRIQKANRENLQHLGHLRRAALPRQVNMGNADDVERARGQGGGFRHSSCSGRP